MGREILLARHGSTGKDYLHKYLGSSDVPLAEEGKRDCRLLGERIRAGFRPALCMCSPLLRARQSAAIVAEVLDDISVAYLDELREIDFGRWEGLSFEEIAEKDPDMVADWAARPGDFHFPGGERISDFRDRVRSVGESLGETEGSILLIAHGGVIRTMICHLLGLPMDNFLLFDVKPARLTVVTQYDRGGVLTGLNL